jgi:hypothetical protein
MAPLGLKSKSAAKAPHAMSDGGSVNEKPIYLHREVASRKDQAQEPADGGQDSAERSPAMGILSVRPAKI